MNDNWQRYAAEEQVRQLEAEVAHYKAMVKTATQKCEEIAEALGCPATWEAGLAEARRLRALAESLDQEAEPDECEQPCSYSNRCDSCSEYWDRMVREGLYDPSTGWLRLIF